MNTERAGGIAPIGGVLLLTDANIFAGTERHILALATALRNEGARVRIGCPAPSPLAERAGKEGIKVIGIPKRGFIDWRAALQLRRLARAGEVAIFHAHNGRTSLTAAMGLWGVGGARLVSSQHFLEPARLRRRGLAALASRMMHRWMNGRIDRFIAVSQAVAKSLGPLGGRVRVVPNGLPACDPGELRPRGEVRAELKIDLLAPLVVCAARLQAEKDIASLIAAMDLARRRFPAARCVVAGDGALRAELQGQIDRLDLNGHVRLLGFRSDVHSLMNAGDCFVLPSLAEPFGLVLLEAMSLARPVIATAAGGPLEIVEDGVTGLLVRPGDPEALAEAIGRVIGEAGAAAEMGRAAKVRFEARFTDRQMAVATKRVYMEMTG